MTTITKIITKQEQCIRTKEKEPSRSTTNKNASETPSYGKYKWLFWEFETPIIWRNVFFIGTLHLLTVYFTLTFDYTQWGLIIYFFPLSFATAFGVTGGVHRYFTHRCYKANLPLRIILVFCYMLAGQNTIIQWVKDHKVHHKYTDTIADPHNAKRGFFFSHVGWLMMRKHPEVIKKGKQMDYTYLYEDPLVMFQHNHYSWANPLVAFVIPSLIPHLLFGASLSESIKMVVFIRYTISLNVTWSVNSFAHIWGMKPYNKNILPVENQWVSFFASGEGYHNYHHTFPWDYRAAELGSRFNFTTAYLNFFHSIGWAYDLRFATPKMVQKAVEKQGDGSHLHRRHEISCGKVEKSDKE